MKEADVATHTNAARLDRADFIIHADLTDFGMPGRWEQLWVRRLQGGHFELCCIPFFTRGFALGDIIGAGARGERQWVLESVVRGAGHRTARFAAASRDQADLLHESMHAMAAAIDLPHEWHGAGYLAIDVPPGHDADAVASPFLAQINAGLLYAELDGGDSSPSEGAV